MKKYLSIVLLAALMLPWAAKAQVTLPFTCGFESDADLTGWTRLNNESTSGLSTTQKHDGQKSFAFHWTTSPSQVLITPELSDIGSPLMVEFWYGNFSGSYVEEFRVGYSSTTATESAMTWSTAVTVSTNTPWTLYSTMVPAGTKYVAISSDAYDAYYLYIDDFYIGLPPTCLQPTIANLTTTSTSITFDIVPGDSEGEWAIKVDTAGWEFVNSTSYELTDLAPASQHTFSLRAVCSEDDTSTAYNFSARTLLADPVSELPYVCGFEDGEDSSWAFFNGTATNKWYLGSATQNGGSRSIYISNNNGTANAYSIGTSSTVYAYRAFTVSEAGDYAVNFDWKGVGEIGSTGTIYDYLTAYIAPATADFSGTSVSTSGWTDISGRLAGSTAWQSKSCVLSANGAGTYYLVLRWYNDSGTGDQPPAAVDNINIYKITCPAVRNLVVDTNTAPTETSITLDWTPVGEETSWAIRVNGGEWTSVSTHPYTVDNLQPSTLYTFDVIAICSDSSFATTLSTRTPCGDMVLPWTEGFENMPTGSNQRPICWTTVQSNSSYPYVSTTNHTGAASLYMYAGSTAPILVATPAITSTTADQLHVSFWGYVSSYGTLYMGVMSDTSDASTFMAIDSVTAGGSTWREYEFYTDGVILSGDFHVAFLWRANSYACYLDDIVVTEAEACRRPTAARADSTSYYTADLSWSDPTENGSYLLRYALTNNVDDEDAIDVPVSDTAYTLTGLSPYTTYYAWVATTCGGTQTEWRSVGSFTTKRSCYPVTGLTVNEATGTAALLSWRYNTQTALEPTGVIVTVAGPQDTLEYETEELQMLLTGLQPASEYRISVRTVCDPDTATAVSTTVSTASCVEVTGSATSSSSPFHGNFNYGYSQTIYPASMLAGMDTISGIAFRTTSTPGSYPTRPVTVFIGYTNATEFSTSSYLPSTALTPVAADTLDVSSTGWKTITFTTPVAVNHSQNIVIAVQNHTGHYSSFNWGAHTQAQQGGIGNTVFWYRDGSAYDITNPGTPSNTSNTNIPDIRFIGECDMSCPAPLVMLDSIDATSAMLSWTEEGDSWVPQYRIANTTQWTDGSAVTEPTATIMGLVPSTYYEFRVMTICGTDTTYSRNRAGRTGCGDITLPWFEGFEGMTTGTGNRPACWTTVQSNNNYPYIYASTRHSGAASLYMYGPDTVPNMVATPKILVNTSDPLRVKYWAYASSYGTLLAGIMSDTSDTETFVAYDTVTNGGSTWREREFYAPIDATGNVYVAFQWRSNNSSSYTCYLDDISIAVADPCRRPIAARVDSVSYYTAIISWTDTANTGSYLLRYARTNNAEDANAVDVAVNDTVHTLTGLSPYTTYYAWVATTCNGIVTDWRNVGSFTTTRSCYPVTGLTVSDVSGTAALITWNYNTQVGIEPSGVIVTVIGPNGDTTNYASEGTQLLLSPLQPASSYAVSVRTVCDPDTATAVSTTVSTASCGEVTGTTSNTYAPYYSYYENGYSQMLYPASMLAGMDTISGVAFRVSTALYSATYNRTVTVYVGYTDMTTLTTSASGYLPASALTQAGTATLDITTTGWKTINFTTPIAVNHSQNIVIAMAAPSSDYSDGLAWGSHTQAEQGGIGNAVYWYRDNTAITPAAPGGTSGTSTTIPDIRFIGECDMSCVAPMLIVDSTTTSTASLSWTMDGTRWIPQYRRAGETNWVSDTATTQTHATITDLSHSTLYEFRVMGICEEGDTTYSSTRTAYTECGEITLPYRYGFEDVATNAFPLCWHRVMGYTSGSTVYPYASTTRHSGARSLYIYNGAATARTIVTTPYIPERLNNLEINLWAYRSSNSLEVGVMTDLNDTSTFVVIDTISAANAASTGIWYEFNYQTPSVLGTLADSGYVAFRMIGNGTYYIDDIEILQYNPCRRPIDFVLDSVSPYTASISWTDSTNAGTYRIYWSDTNDIDNANFTDVNATHVTLSGLQADTRYYLWARTLCDSNSTSELATVGSFQTQISCYPILGLTNTSITSDAASFSWNLDSRGLPVDSVLVTLVDLTDSNAAPFTEAAMGSTYHIFTNLSESHKYKAYFSPMCNPDTAEAVEYEFTTISPVCHEVAGDMRIEKAPFNAYYNYGYSQILYPASELDSNLNDITGISFRLSDASSLGSCLVRIYMGNTPDTAVRRGTLVPASRLTLVADSAVIDVSNAGWTSIALDTVFTYDPDSNLVIAIENLTGSYAHTYWSGHTRGAGTWVSYYNDNNLVTLSTVQTNSSISGTDSDTSTVMPDIRFHGYCDAPACVAPLAVVTGQDTTTVTLSWMAGGDETSWIVEYRHIDSTAWMVSGTGITASPYTVSGLNHSTHYMFRVGSLCSNGDTVYSNTLEAITECSMDHIPATYNVNNYIHGNMGEFPCWGYASIGLGGAIGNVYISFTSASSIIILPEIAEALNTAQVRMKVSTNASAGTLFRVGVADGNNYTWIDTLTIGYTSTYSTQGEEYVVHLNNYSGNGNRVILGGMTSSTVYLREVVVEPMETCFPVEGISFSNISDATATVTLNHAGATEYIVEYREATASTWETTTFNGTTGTLSGLSPVTSYVVRARAVCTAGDTSRMGNVTGVFTTEMCDGGSSAINYTADMTASTSSYSPIGYSLFNYSYVQTIIDSAYLASIDGDITAIAFHPASTTGGTQFTQMDVYMANVAESDLASAFILPDTNHEFVHVMSGATLNYSDTTWQVHLLDSAFTWDGHSNILVAVNRNHGSYSGTSSFRAHNTPTSSSVRKMRYIYRDGSAYDINTVNTVTGATASTAVGDIRLYSCPSSEPGTTYTVTLSTSNGSMGTVSPMGATTVDAGASFTATATPNDGYLFVAWVTNDQTVSTENPYTFTVNANVSLTAVFEAEPAPDCIVPTGVSVSNETFDGATISWTPGEEGQDTWQVHVYNTTFDTVITSQTTSVTVTGLYSGSTYNVSVRTMCSATAFSVWSEAESLTTLECVAPTGVTLSAEGNSVTVSWQSTGATHYRVSYYIAEYTTGGTDVEVENATTVTIDNIPGNESYDFYVYAYCGENTLSQASEKATVTLGIEDVYGEHIGLYPNPASTTVTIEGIEGRATVTMVDLNGRETGKWSVNGGTLTINVNGMAKGTYFVRIANEKSTAVRKLVVR